MLTRWRALFGSALVTLVGVAWLAQSFGASLSSWLSVQLVGMVVACGLGFAGVVTGTRRRWPAGLALVCAAPMAQSLWHISFLPTLIRFTGLPGVLWIGGSLVTIAVASYVALAAPPPIPFDPIPPARTT